MLTATLTIEGPRRWWNPLRRGRFVLRIPETWEEVQPSARRRRWWRWAMALPRPAAQGAMLRDVVPCRWQSRLSDMDLAALAQQLDWTAMEAQCEQVPMPQFSHRGQVYEFPSARGANVTAVEFALCDDLYKQFVEGDLAALTTLAAAMWREHDPDAAAALRRGDFRVPLHSKEEAEERAARLKNAPPEMLAQALWWFAGLKLYVNRVYGKWLFEPEEDDDEDEEGLTPGPSPKERVAERGGPNFGWWGVFLDVAECGVFGPLDRVYQTSIHDVCMFLVQKRAASPPDTPTAPAFAGGEEED